MQPQTRPAGSLAGDTLALSVLGARGVVDLVVPATASAEEVAAEYARQAGLSEVPVLRTELGRALSPTARPIAATVGPGDVLVAVPPDLALDDAHRPDGYAARRTTSGGAPLATVLLGLAAGAALAAGWYAARLGTSSERTVAVNVLIVAAVAGILPVGRMVHLRSALAPVFGGAAAYAVLGEAGADRQPLTWGVTALVAAVTAAAGRALLPADEASGGEPVVEAGRHDEAHLVWMVGGVLVFTVVVAGVLLRLPAPVVWITLLVLAMLAARLVPQYAVSVPDQLLVDLERLAVSAWSARERPPGRRGRMVIARPMVARIAQRGQRLIAAASIGIAAVAAGSVSLLLRSDLPRTDRLGSSLLALFVGGGLLFAARSYRNLTARVLLRAGGLACWVVLTLAVVPEWGATARAWGLLTALLVGALSVVSAVATGRGWRSIWWARRAEVGEACCGAFAIASASVACGLFRMLWQLTSRLTSG